MFEFNIGQKVRVKYDYWKICDQIYEDNHPLWRVSRDMAKFIGKIFVIKDRQSFGRNENVYLLDDLNGKTDGLCWREELLEGYDADVAYDTAVRALKNIGIDVVDKETGKMKSMNEVLEELANKWDELDKEILLNDFL